MKKLQSIFVCLVLAVVCCGLAGGGDYAGPDYFAVIKSPTNFRIEYKKYSSVTVEIRDGNRVCLFSLGSTPAKAYSKTDKKKERSILGASSDFCNFTHAYRYVLADKRTVYEEKYQYEAIFLERQVTVFVWITSKTMQDGTINIGKSEYYVDNEHDVVLKCNKYLSRNGGEEQQTDAFEAILFVVGGQSIPTI